MAYLIQNSAVVYSKKVEYLHALVHQTLNSVSTARQRYHRAMRLKKSKKNGSEEALEDEDELTANGQFAFRERDQPALEEQFLPLDDIEEAKDASIIMKSSSSLGTASVQNSSMDEGKGGSGERDAVEGSFPPTATGGGLRSRRLQLMAPDVRMREMLLVGAARAMQLPNYNEDTFASFGDGQDTEGGGRGGSARINAGEDFRLNRSFMHSSGTILLDDSAAAGSDSLSAALTMRKLPPLNVHWSTAADASEVVGGPSLHDQGDFDDFDFGGGGFGDDFGDEAGFMPQNDVFGAGAFAEEAGSAQVNLDPTLDKPTADEEQRALAMAARNAALQEDDDESGDDVDESEEEDSDEESDDEDEEDEGLWALLDPHDDSEGPRAKQPARAKTWQLPVSLSVNSNTIHSSDLASYHSVSWSKSRASSAWPFCGLVAGGSSIVERALRQPGDAAFSYLYVDQRRRWRRAMKRAAVVTGASKTAVDALINNALGPVSDNAMLDGGANAASDEFLSAASSDNLQSGDAEAAADDYDFDDFGAGAGGFFDDNDDDNEVRHHSSSSAASPSDTGASSLSAADEAAAVGLRLPHSTLSEAAMAVEGTSSVARQLGLSEEEERHRVQLSVAESYEQRCRAYVAAYLNDAARHVHQSSLAQRVAAWQRRLTPVLKENKTRGEFSLRETAKDLLNVTLACSLVHSAESAIGLDEICLRFAESNDKAHEVAAAEESAGRKAKRTKQAVSNEELGAVDADSGPVESWQIARQFAASLQLVNDGCLDIVVDGDTNYLQGYQTTENSASALKKLEQQDFAVDLSKGKAKVPQSSPTRRKQRSQSRPSGDVKAPGSAKRSAATLDEKENQTKAGAIEKRASVRVSTRSTRPSRRKAALSGKNV